MVIYWLILTDLFVQWKVTLILQRKVTLTQNLCSMHEVQYTESDIHIFLIIILKHFYSMCAMKIVIVYGDIVILTQPLPPSLTIPNVKLETCMFPWSNRRKFRPFPSRCLIASSTHTTQRHSAIRWCRHVWKPVSAFLLSIICRLTASGWHNLQYTHTRTNARNTRTQFLFF